MIVTIVRHVKDLMDGMGPPHAKAEIALTVADEGVRVKFPKKMRRALEDYAREAYDEKPFQIPAAGKHVRLSIDLAERKVVGMWVLQWVEREIEDEY